MGATKRVPLAIVSVFVTGLAVLIVTACDLPVLSPTEAVGTPTNTPAPAEPVTGEPTPLPGEVTLQPPAFVTVTLWTTEAFSPTGVVTSGQVLAAEASRFLLDNPDVRLQFVLKKPYGDGGILDRLKTTGDAVPSLLPDLIFIDVDQLVPAVQAGLVQPLEGLLPAGMVNDLYPFARQACTVDGRLYCLQYLADLDHLAYDMERVPVPPATWPDVLNSPGPYAFPAGGQDGLVNDDTMAQYLAVRSWPIDDRSDEPFLDEDSLAAVLQYYQDASAREVFAPEILNFNSTDESWDSYAAGQSAMTHVSAHRFLTEPGRSQGTAAAAIPTINGPVSAVSRGWALALVTTDPFRQPAAVAFMTGLMAPETNAAWNGAAGYLPTTQTAITFRNSLDLEDNYTPFIHQQLLMARRRPRLPNYAQVAAVLQLAVQSVLDSSATPEEAAAKAVEGSR